MKLRIVAAALSLTALAMPATALANQADVTLASFDRAAQDGPEQALAMELIAAISMAPDYSIDLPAGYVSTDPNYDPLAGWSPD